MKLKNFLLFFVISINLASCLKKVDGPINVPTPSFAQDTIFLKGDYSQKCYYNLETQSVVKYSSSLDWDIAFNLNSKDQKIILNYALGIACNGFSDNNMDFNVNKSLADFNNHPIYYSNFYDTFANLFAGNFIGNSSLNFVYYLNFGSKGAKKFQLLEYVPNSYAKFQYSNLDGSNLQTQNIALTGNTNFVYFSLFDNSIKNVEPPNKNDWDLEITRYTTLVTDFGVTQMYAVGGFLFNPSKSLRAAKKENVNIESISSKSEVSGLSYSSDYQAIGYDWKSFSNQSANGYYTIYPRTYIINSEINYYTLQFLGYSLVVNGQPTNGYPNFLINKLN